MKKLVYLLSIFSFLLLLFSCSSEQQVFLKKDGTGTVAMDITLEPMLVNYLDDLYSFSGGGSVPPSFFDLEKIKDAFRGFPDLKLISVETPSKDRLNLRFSFQRIEGVFTGNLGSEITPVAAVSKRNTGQRVSLLLNRENYERIVERILTLSGMIEFKDYIGALLEPGPKETILEIYQYAFEDFAGSRSVADVLGGSAIKTTFTVPGEITDHKGGTVRTHGGIADTITYTIPLLDILTIDTPLEFWFDFSQQ